MERGIQIQCPRRHVRVERTADFLEDTLKSITERFQLVEDVFDDVDSYVQETAEAAGIGDISFTLLPDSSDLTEDEDSEHDLLYAGSGEGFDYLLSVSLSPMEEDGSISCSGQIYRIEGEDGSETVSVFNYKKAKWESPKSLREMFCHAASDDADGKWFQAIAEVCDTSVLSLDYDCIMRDYRKAVPLFPLYRRLHGMAAFDFRVTEGREKDGSDQIQTLLVPAECGRIGSAVAWEKTEKGNGKFVLYQYYSRFQDACFCEEEDAVQSVQTGKPCFDCSCSDSVKVACISRSVRPGQWRQPNEKCTAEQKEDDLKEFFRPVSEFNSVSEAAKVLYFLWDHFTGDDPVFQFPLSGRAYVETENPYKRISSGDVCYLYGDRKMNQQESKEIFFLQKEFFSFPEKENSHKTSRSTSHPLGVL